MMTPFTDLYTAMFACMVPVLAAMLGSLVLGCLIGWVHSPGPIAGTPRLQATMDDLRKRLADTGQKLALSGTIMQQRMEAQENDAVNVRKALEDEVVALNADIRSLREALAAAKRAVPEKIDLREPRVVEKKVPDPAHLERIAQRERAAARMPGLLRELDELREAVRLGGTPASNGQGTQALPAQVYRVMSDTFGRRIAQDDLLLVEGIGPKIQQQLKKNGLKTWADVASAKPDDLKKVLARAGDRFQSHDPSSWPEQCKLMVEHRWDELRKYQRKLSNAR